jgi:hypothetical protein
MKPLNQILAKRIASLLLLAVSTSALVSAQERRPVHFSGLINDYTPSNVKGGPYEMHGQWAMDIDAYRSSADFTADMTMSDYGMTSTGAPDATQGGQNAHTHHIKLTNVHIKWDMTGCPAYSPATTHGFQMSGTVSLITGNGGPAPFEPVPVVSTLQVCVSGGTDVDYSNLSMVFGGPATTHFGPQAIHGVVRKADDVRR